jgi:hypothetical protein
MVPKCLSPSDRLVRHDLPVTAIELSLFDEVGEVVRGLVPAKLGAVRCRPRAYGIKVWLDAEKPPRDHYEAQVIGKEFVPEARVLALEVGFHAEHSKAAENDALLEPLTKAESRWRRVLGADPVVGEFLGPVNWRRISETWPDINLGEEGLAIEIGVRLVDYITALEPLRGRSSSGTGSASARPARR